MAQGAAQLVVGSCRGTGKPMHTTPVGDLAECIGEPTECIGDLAECIGEPTESSSSEWSEWSDDDEELLESPEQPRIPQLEPPSKALLNDANPTVPSLGPSRNTNRKTVIEKLGFGSKSNRWAK